MKSHRKIEPESLSSVPNKKPKTVKRRAKPKLKPSKGYMMKLKAKSVVNFLLLTIAGQNRIGEGLHGILDLLPVPNQIIAKSASYLTKGDKAEAKRELNKIFTVRNVIAVVAFVLFATGTITLRDMLALLEAISAFI